MSGVGCVDRCSRSCTGELGTFKPCHAQPTPLEPFRRPVVAKQVNVRNLCNIRMVMMIACVSGRRDKVDRSTQDAT